MFPGVPLIEGGKYILNQVSVSKVLCGPLPFNMFSPS